MPTVIILLFTLLVMVTVIPYAFSAVIKQLQGVWALEDQSRTCNSEHVFEIFSFPVAAEAALIAANEAAGITEPEQLVEESTPCSC